MARMQVQMVEKRGLNKKARRNINLGNKALSRKSEDFQNLRGRLRGEHLRKKTEISDTNLHLVCRDEAAQLTGEGSSGELKKIKIKTQIILQGNGSWGEIWLRRE